MGKKNKKAIWIADEYAIDAELNRALLDMLHTRTVAKPKKAKRIYKELLAQRAAEEKAPCMGAGKAEVIQEVIARVGNPQMGRGKTATIPLVTSTKQYFEVQDVGYENDIAGFEKMPDGTFNVAVIEDGGRISSMTMVPSQLAAFKQWVMEN
jgi:hypothetical protein